jgi:ketosteroid isomerase-like protein
MPSNLELAAALNEILPTGDWVAAMRDEEALGRRLDTLRELAWPDLEIAMAGPGGFTGTFHGVEGFREAWADWLQAFQTYEVEIEEIRESGEHVIGLAHHTATTHGSDVPMREPAAAIMTFRDGRLARLEFTLDRDAALRAAGLEPPPG